MFCLYDVFIFPDTPESQVPTMEEQEEARQEGGNNSGSTIPGEIDFGQEIEGPNMALIDSYTSSYTHGGNTTLQAHVDISSILVIGALSECAYT